MSVCRAERNIGCAGLLGTGCVERVPEDAPGNDASSVSAVAMYKPAPETPRLSCTIHGGATCELGSVPKVTVAITNQTDADIYLVGSLDGSDWKGRYRLVRGAAS
jgi:hypothetical protein